MAEVGIEAVKMRKAMTGAIILVDPSGKDRKKASTLATRLAQIWDPATVRVAVPARIAELRVVGIDVSVAKEELPDILALAAEWSGVCGGVEVQVAEIGTSRSDLGSSWVHCPLVRAKKLAQAGTVALGWSIARVEAIAKRSLQCFKYLELGHVRTTCVSTVDRSHLCYRCGEADHRARGCPASTPSASRSGHLRPTGWEERRAARRRRKTGGCHQLLTLPRRRALRIQRALKEVPEERYESGTTRRPQRARGAYKVYSTKKRKKGVLGPLLFTIYTADLPTLTEINAATFADDAALLASHSDPIIVSSTLQ